MQYRKQQSKAKRDLQPGTGAWLDVRCCLGLGKFSSVSSVKHRRVTRRVVLFGTWQVQQCVFSQTQARDKTWGVVWDLANSAACLQSGTGAWQDVQQRSGKPPATAGSDLLRADWPRSVRKWPSYLALTDPGQPGRPGSCIPRLHRLLLELGAILGGLTSSPNILLTSLHRRSMGDKSTVSQWSVETCPPRPHTP